MNTDKKVLYILSGIFSGIILLCCFVPKKGITGLIFGIVSLVFALCFSFLVRKRSILKIHHRQVALIMTGIAVVIITVYFLSGIYFGFLTVAMPKKLLIIRIFPLIISAICAEVIRRVLTSQESKISVAVSYISLTMLDILILSDGNVLKSHSAFMAFVSVAVFPSLTANILYCYISKRYGALPNIIYRIPISLYPYILSIKPNIPEGLLGFIRVILPIMILLFIHALYEPRKFTVKKTNKAISAVFTTLLLLISVGLLLLTSCRFRFGLLVIATESMTGSVNKGDAVIYEEYRGAPLEEGQIIVFSDNGDRKTVHRITQIENIDGKLYVYTKGDANEANDTGFRTADDIIGTVNLKIKYLGYPTVWMRELFK